MAGRSYGPARDGRYEPSIWMARDSAVLHNVGCLCAILGHHPDLTALHGLRKFAAWDRGHPWTSGRARQAPVQAAHRIGTDAYRPMFRPIQRA